MQILLNCNPTTSKYFQHPHLTDEQAEAQGERDVAVCVASVAWGSQSNSQSEFVLAS
jgi:hypothetical protein